MFVLVMKVAFTQCCRSLKRHLYLYCIDRIVIFIYKMGRNLWLIVHQKMLLILQNVLYNWLSHDSGKCLIKKIKNKNSKENWNWFGRVLALWLTVWLPSWPAFLNHFVCIYQLFSDFETKLLQFSLMLGVVTIQLFTIALAVFSHTLFI